jgi:hypothetical protein
MPSRSVLTALALLSGLPACTKSSPPVPPASPEDRERIGHLADEMLTVARGADAKRTAAIRAAADTLEPRGDLGPCPIKVPVVGTEDRAKLGEGEPRDAPVDWRSIRAEQMMVVTRPGLATEQSVRLKHVEEMIAFERDRADTEGVAEVQKWIRYYGDLKNDSWEMVIVADRRIDPELAPGGKFRGGVILGRAFVYSFVDDAVVCAADVVAESSNLLTNHQVIMKDGKDWGLVFDLENEAFRAAARAMVRAGVRAAPDGSSTADAGEPDAAAGRKAKLAR